MNLNEKIKQELTPKKAQVKRKANGFIKHDYLVPAGPYQEQWDWDAFFIGMSLASEIPSEAIYLKNWAMNYLEHTKKDGYTPGLLTPKGIDNRLKHVKPFLAQGSYFAARFLNDYSWLLPYWPNLKKSVKYRHYKYFDKKTGLSCWYNSMESGADNNIASLNYPIGSVVSADLNAFLYREYKALSLIASKLSLKKDQIIFKKKSEDMKKAILKYLWSNEDKIFYNIDLKTGEFIKRASYSSLIPLWANIASRKQGREMIKKYVINSKKFWAKHGVRTLSADDKEYNQANIIKPYSNWQGPVWPIVNYLSMHSLLNYGFKKETEILAEKISNICLNDIKKTGGMHENYHAETGKPLAAPDFISWNLLVGQMIDQSESGYNPFAL